MDQLVDDKGKKEGDIADLGGGWWFISTADASVSNKLKDKKNLCASGAAEIGISHEAKAVGETFALSIKIFGLSLEVTAATVGTVKIGPGPNISYDGAKSKLTTNSVYVNTLTGMELTTAQHRTALNNAKAVIAQIDKIQAHIDAGGADMTVSQVIQS